MIEFERFGEILDELAEELPQEFYEKLNMGIRVEESSKLHNKAIKNDLYVLGEYQRSNLGRGIVIFYGSFEKLHGNLDEDAMRVELRRVLRHEFRHHLEYRAGERGLEIEDQKQIEKYLRKGNNK